MDSKELADKHFEEHRSSSWVPEEKMGPRTQNAGKSISNEVRVVDPNTGGEKGSKLARYDLIPVEFEEALAEHYGKGARKYDDRNWERGYKWSLSVAALRRHLAAWLRGEDNDSETGSNHLIAVAWHAVALYIFQLRGLGTDDIRPRK
jgi:hypothetical protein